MLPYVNIHTHRPTGSGIELRTAGVHPWDAATQDAATLGQRLGGAQAVAAMAYGTESIPRVDKIFGPGNRYVTKAKQLVGANDVAVDLPAGPSEVLVLAEPAAGLDPQGRRDIFGGIRAYNRETGSTVVIVSHSMEDMAQYCDDVAVMAHARLLMTGTRDEVFARADELEAVGLDIPVITKLSALLRQGGMPLDPGLYTLEAAEAALAQVFGLPADREGGRKR